MLDERDIKTTMALSDRENDFLKQIQRVLPRLLVLTFINNHRQDTNSLVYLFS